MGWYGLPDDVFFCRKCVISNQRPNSVVEFKNGVSQTKPTIEFNDDGICSACQFHEIKTNEIDWDARERELQVLCDRYRKDDGTYDCLVPGSGGKDSMYVSHMLKYKYGMNPLTVTWAPHEYTEIGKANFTAWCQDGFSNITITPDRRLHRYLTREAFFNLGHPFQPFIIGQRAIGPKLASSLGIPLVFYGENQAEYGNNISENDVPTMNPQFYSLSDINELTIAGKTVAEHCVNTDFVMGDFDIYRPADTQNISNIEFHYFGYYHFWDPQEIYYFVAENTDFAPSPHRTDGSYSKYSSIDDKIDMIHYYTTLMKFGLGRASYDASQEIRNGKITREEGVALVKRYDLEFPSTYIEDVLTYLEITLDEFIGVCDRYRSPHLWALDGSDWVLKKPVWL